MTSGGRSYRTSSSTVFPRTIGQVPLLDQFERRYDFAIGCYLEIDVSRAGAVARMTGRRVCPQCGATYHLIAKPPRVLEKCDHDGTTLERRPDDTTEVVEFRQQVYDSNATPILKHYQEVCPDLCRRVDGNQSFRRRLRRDLPGSGCPRASPNLNKSEAIMPYSDFSLESATQRLGITTEEAHLFPAVAPVAAPEWLVAMLGRRTQLALISEKARSEFIVAPVLVASREIAPTSGGSLFWLSI